MPLLVNEHPVGALGSCAAYSSFGEAVLARRLAGTNDARGRRIEVIPFDVIGSAMAGPHSVGVTYLNCYLANGAVVVPLAGGPPDELVLADSRMRSRTARLSGFPAPRCPAEAAARTASPSRCR